MKRLFIIFYFLFSAFAGLSSPLIQGQIPGLVGWWTFNEGSGTNAFDYSGNGNTGALINSPVRTNGVIGGALSFNGTSTYVVANSSPVNPASNSFTISMWVNVKSFAYPECGTCGPRVILCNLDGINTFQMIIGKSAGSTNSFGFAIEQSGTFYIQEITADIYLTNTWYNIAFSFDENTHAVVVYVNGVSVPTTVFVGTYSGGTANGKLYLAVRSDLVRYFNGLLDDVCIYNRVLTAAEVEQLYGSGYGYP